MGAITYDFASVPQIPERKNGEADDAWDRRRRVFRGIYQDLQARNLPLPTRPAPTQQDPGRTLVVLDEDISRDDMVAHLQKLCGDAVAKEVGEHREVYEGGGLRLTNGQIALILQRAGTLHGIPYAPNLLSADDIDAALF